MSYRSSESKLEEEASSGKIDLCLVGAHPLLDKGGGFTGERERVWMFLGLVAHAE